MSEILHGYPQPEKNYYKVYVRSITYNHAPYIVDCLNGVAMQQTSFPFVHHVIDDKSTDGESGVIEQWLNDNCKMDEAVYYDSELSNTIMAVHRKNANYMIVVDFLKNSLYQNPRKQELYKPWRDNCPYEALCEGDDYWTDPYKLQKQVDFLEAHEECPFCFHLAKVQSDSEKEQKIYSYTQEGYYSDRDIYSKWVVPTASVIYRREDLKYYPPCSPLIYGDIYLFLCLLHGGKKAYCFDFYGSVYRRHDGGLLRIAENDASHKYYEMIIKQYRQFYKIFPSLRDITVRTIKEYLVELVNAPYFNNQWKHCLHYLFLRKRLLFSNLPLRIVKLYFKSMWYSISGHE